MPLVEIDEFVLDARRTVLIEYLVYCSGKSLRIVVGKLLIVVQKYSRMIVGSVERFEILGVVREQDDGLIRTPLEEFDVVRVFSELVFRLNDVVSTFVEQSFEDPTDVFVEKDPRTPH